MSLHPNSREAVRESNRQRALVAKAARLERERLARAGMTTPLLDAAKAERGTGIPLVVEPLFARLERALPGATCREERPTGIDAWVVRSSRGARLSVGPSLREAIDRAVLLHGAR